MAATMGLPLSLEGVDALKAISALEMGLNEDELPALMDVWRQVNPRIVEF